MDSILKTEVNLIYQDVINKKRHHDYSLGLFDGIAGEILFLGNLHKNQGDESIYNQLSILLDYSIDLVQKNVDLVPSYSSGLAGWAWVIEYLNRNSIIKVDSSFLTQIDEILQKSILILLKQGEIDQINGALGIVKYFLDKNMTAPCLPAINYLQETAHFKSDHVFWTRKNSHSEIIDLGLAHGQAGIAYILWKYYLQTNSYQVKTLLEGIIRLIKFSIQDFNKNGSSISSYLNVSDYNKGIITSKESRLAWCYGDMGVFYTLYKIGQSLGDVDLTKISLDILVTNAKERMEKDTSVVDVGFCHGTIGVSYIFYKMWLETKSEDFLNAFQFWLNRTFELKKLKGDYYFLIGDFEQRDYYKSTSLLEGISGIGLVYLTLLNNKNTTWDKCFLL